MNLKDHIISLSYDLFATKGYDKTTTSDMVKSSGSFKAFVII